MEKMPSLLNGHEAITTKRIYKVVLTGGPCGGKTTGQSRLCTFFENLGWKVYRVPETASVLLGGGVKFADLSEAQTFQFQENLLRSMIQIENTFFNLAESSEKNCLVICDRGTMDPSAFISSEKWEIMMKNIGINSVEIRDTRYHQIIHMVSAANGAEAFYSTEDHSCRSENLDLALTLDKRAAEAWVGHPYFDVIDNSTDFDTKIRRMITVVCQKMGIDTGDRLETDARKLKFLVHGPLPSDAVFPPFQDFNVEHIYLRTNSRKMQARLRKRGKNGNNGYTHTIRKPEKLGQIVEVKTAISQRDWTNMHAQADEHHFQIYKKRRCFLYNNQYYQLDIYQEPCHPRCNGLFLLETYSTLNFEHLRQRMPPFLNIVDNVTGRPEYSMFNLSLKDEWKDSKKFCHSIAVESCVEDPVDNLEDEGVGSLSCGSLSPNCGLMSHDSTIHLCPQFSLPGPQELTELLNAVNTRDNLVDFHPSSDALTEDAIIRNGVALDKEKGIILEPKKALVVETKNNLVDDLKKGLSQTKDNCHVSELSQRKLMELHLLSK